MVDLIVVLTHEVDLRQIALVLLNALLPVLLEHVVVVFELRVLTLRQVVAADNVTRRVHLHAAMVLVVAGTTHQVLLAPIIAENVRVL